MERANLTIINSFSGLHLLERELKLTEFPYTYFDYGEEKLKVDRFYFQRFKETASLECSNGELICDNCKRLFEILGVNLSDFNRINIDWEIRYNSNFNFACKDYIGILFAETSPRLKTISIHPLRLIQQINIAKLRELINLFNQRKVLILIEGWIEVVFVKEEFILKTFKDMYQRGWEIYQFDKRTIYDEYDYPIGEYYITEKFKGEKFVRIPKSEISQKAFRVFGEINNKYSSVFVGNVLPLNTLERINYWRNYYRRFKGGKFDEFSSYTCKKMKEVILNEIKFTSLMKPLLEFIKRY